LSLAVCIFACLGIAVEQAQVAKSDLKSTERQVRTILAEARRIDAANDAPDTSEQHHLSVDFPHWQFSGLFRDTHPLFLNAIFTEGQVVREESYYLLQDKPLLVKVSRWWDVDEGAKAPETAINQDFYLSDSQIIRRVIKIESSPAKRRTLDTGEPAAAFGERASLIVKILSADSHDAKMAQALQSFPEAELPAK